MMDRPGVKPDLAGPFDPRHRATSLVSQTDCAFLRGLGLAGVANPPIAFAAHPTTAAQPHRHIRCGGRHFWCGRCHTLVAGFCATGNLLYPSLR
jgi:hypothetical protein